MNTIVLQEPTFVPVGTHPWIDLGDHRARVLISSENSRGDFLLAETEVEAQGGVPPHVHCYEEETFYIQQGQFEFLIGEERLEAGPGDTALAPREVPHAWRCLSEHGGKFVLLVTPGENFESFASEMARLNITPGDPDSLAALKVLSEQHGIAMLPLAP